MHLNFQKVCNFLLQFRKYVIINKQTKKGGATFMFGEIIGAISNFMYSYLLIIMLIGVGLYYTLRTRLVQVLSLIHI